ATFRIWPASLRSADTSHLSEPVPRARARKPALALGRRGEAARPQDLVEPSRHDLLVSGAHSRVLVADEATLDAVATDQPAGARRPGGAPARARLQLGLEELQGELVRALGELDAGAGRQVDGDDRAVRPLDADLAPAHRLDGVRPRRDLDAGVGGAAVRPLAAALEAVEPLLAAEQAE